MSTEMLRPLIVPNEYFASGQFPAPHVPLAAPDLALTCVLLSDPGAMVYVTPDAADALGRSGIEWRAAALAAMRRSDEGLLWTQDRHDEDGRLLWLEFMNVDGLGSSRLLLRDDLERQFPEGYLVALPDRSCGLAISKSVDEEVLEELRAMVTEMHRAATTPMCPDLREPGALVPRAA